MSRPFWLSLVIFTLSTEAVPSEISPIQTAPQQGVGVVTDTQASEDSYPAAQQAFELGAELKHQGNFPGAAAHFRRVLQLVDSSSDLGNAAEQELLLYLPILEAQRLVVSGDAKRAQEVLHHAVQLNRNQPERLRLLNEMLRNISLLQGMGANDKDVDGQVVLKKVEAILIEHRARTGSYPRSYEELNGILPADRAPLEHYDIVHYSGGRNQFVLSLRSKTNQADRLTLHKTGLLR